MTGITVIREIPGRFVSGILTGSLKAYGGIIKDVRTGQIVGHLREAVMQNGLGVSQAISTTLANVGAVSSFLNLGVTTVGFAMVMQKLGTLEKQLALAQEVITRKLDLTFYANFRAALDLASNAFTMNNPENRKISALQAVNRFLEAEHHYTKILDAEMGMGSQVADEYLYTLALAYLTEVRCYLELEEIDTASRRLQEGVNVVKPRAEKLAKTLLTQNPAAYLHPSLKDTIPLKRLTRVFQWFDPALTETAFFEAQRENLFKFAQNPGEWAKSAPLALQAPKSNALAKMMSGPQGVLQRLPETLTLIESTLESATRMEAYDLEIKAFTSYGLSFKEWSQLAPPDDGENTSGVICLIPEEASVSQ